MNYKLSEELDKKLRKIYPKNKQLIQKAGKQLNLFRENHLHPSLRVHKLSGKLNNFWSMSVDKNYRMLFMIEDEEAYFFDFGTYDQVYK